MNEQDKKRLERIEGVNQGIGGYRYRQEAGEVIRWLCTKQREAEAELTKVGAQRDRLRNALEFCAHLYHGRTSTVASVCMEAESIVEKALAELEKET